MNITDTLAIRLIKIGLIISVILVILFAWHEPGNLKLSDKIDDGKISNLGTVMSGLVGTLLSLAGVILFYVALTEQRKDMVINRGSLELQTKALTQQIKEFELQTKELEATRQVYLEQSKTQQMQRFESTFFQMLTLHHSLVDAISLRDAKQKVASVGRDSFKTMYLWFTETRKSNLESDAIDTYLIMYDAAQESLGHYYRNLYHIFKFIDKSEISNKKFYAGLVRAQLSSYELLFLAYNCLSHNGSMKFKPFVEKYSLLKNLDWSMIDGGKAMVRRFDARAYGYNDFQFLESKPDWVLSDIN